MSKTGEWFKSSFSGVNGNCVEVKLGDDGSASVRDTKQAGSGPVLSFTSGEWRAFVAGVRQGEFDVV